MDVITNLSMGFALALQPANLLSCFIGVFLGTLVGILPGLGPAATLAMLLPLTFGMGATTTMIMMAGVFYGAKYGGAITSVLVNLPGESSSVMTCLDGYQMAKQGRAGPALGMAAIASFFAGTLGVVGLMLLAPPLAEIAITFGPPEYFSLIALGMTMVIFLAGKSMLKALIMGLFGLLIATVGADEMSGMDRLTFGMLELLSGIDFVIAAMGLFAIGEILLNLEENLRAEVFPVPRRLRELLPTGGDVRECLPTLVRSTVMGFLIGVLPGGNPTIATFMAYGTTRAVAKDPDSFGKGTIRGVAAPESADNAASSGGLVPLLTLGIPGTGSAAMMMAALIMAGLRPGPLLLKEQPEFFWTVVASMYVGNVILLILNLPLVPLFANMLKVPYYILYPMIMAICSVGVYSLNNSLFDVELMWIFGVLGYFAKKFDFPAAPTVLALVLANTFERALRQSLLLSSGSPTIFFLRPVSAVLLTIAILVLAVPVVKGVLAARRADGPAVSG